MASTPQKFNLGSPPLQFGVNFKNETINTGPALTPLIKTVAFDSSGSQIPLPSFVKFDTQS